MPSKQKDIFDIAVENEIMRLEKTIESWVKQHDLWDDCGFRSHLKLIDAEPWKDQPVVTIFTSDGDFNRVFDGTEYTDHLYEDFTSLLERNGYWFERDTGRVYIFAEDSTKNEMFKKYFHWQWVCSLVREDFNDLHHEVFDYFSNKHERLQALDGREFEILVYEALRNQGFNVELGPRSGDGGIDIRMLQRDPIGDVMTAVQIKRYRHDRKIGLEAIQALHGAKVAEGLHKSIFVTSSDYLPSAKNFAARKNVSMQLYTSSDVIEWCQQARQGIIKNKATLVSLDHTKKKLRDATFHPQENIVHAHTGVTVIMNSFALILKEAKHAALLMELPRRAVTDDGYQQRGTEVPVVDLSALNNHTPETVFRAKKKWREGQPSFWTGKNLYKKWGGQPQHFDYCD